MPPTIALCSKVPLLGNAVEHKMLKSTFPVPEITWAGWKRQQPGCHLSALFARKGLTPWRERQDQAYFSGSLDNGRWRRRLRALVEVQAAGGFHDLAVKDVSSDFFHWSTPRAMRGKGGGRGGSRGGGRGGAKGGDKRVDGRGGKKDPIDAPCGARWSTRVAAAHCRRDEGVVTRSTCQGKRHHAD